MLHPPSVLVRVDGRLSGSHTEARIRGHYVFAEVPCSGCLAGGVGATSLSDNRYCLSQTLHLLLTWHAHCPLSWMKEEGGVSTHLHFES